MAVALETYTFSHQRNGAHSKEGGSHINPQMGATRMTTASPLPMDPSNLIPPSRHENITRSRFGRVSESEAVEGIVGVAMVGLLEKDPRLAMRAARVLLEDGYRSRQSARRARRRTRMRYGGD
jgi:hypothetical protein